MLKRWLGLTAAMALLFVFSMQVSADERTGTAQLTLEKGDLTILDKSAIPPEMTEFNPIGDRDINFGTENIVGIGDTFTGNTIGIIISDARGQGESSDWMVTLLLHEFTLNGDEVTVTLRGSKMELTADTASVVPSTAPQGTTKAVNENGGCYPGAQSGTEIFRSGSGGSSGLWGANWTPELKVPGTAEVGVHKAKLTWTLTSGEI